MQAREIRVFSVTNVENLDTAKDCRSRNEGNTNRAGPIRAIRAPAREDLSKSSASYPGVSL